MSETTRYGAVVSGPWWWVQEIRPGVGVTQNIRVPSAEMAERIARLLTEEDEKIERDRRRRTFVHRCHACGSTNGYQYGSDAAEVAPGLGWHCNDCEMERWESAQIRATSRPAAYRAATEAEQ